MILIKESDTKNGEIGVMEEFSKKKLDEMIWGHYGADDGWHVSKIVFGKDEYEDISITLISANGNMERFLEGTLVVQY